MTEYIRTGKYGKLFLERLQEEIDELAVSPDGNGSYFFHESDQLIQQGYEAKEPALLYLNAEMQRRGAGMGIAYILNLYIEAARFGSIHAALWLAYCESKGLCAISDLDRADVESCLKEAEHPETVVLTELAFLEDEFDYLWGQVDRADFMEDAIATAPEYRELKDDPAAYPDPSWRTLLTRSMALAEHIHDLAQPYCYKPYEYSAFALDPSRGIIIREEKKAWENWCREKGLLGGA